MAAFFSLFAPGRKAHNLKNINEDLEKIIGSVEKDINDFCENKEQFDDTTMFAIRLK